MTPDEQIQALRRQVQYLQEQLHAPAILVQWRADRAIMAETANVAETAMATNSPVPANANEPAREEHTRAQPRAFAKSNAAAYAQAVMSSDPSMSPTVKPSTRTNDNDRDHPVNAASSSVTACPEPARNPVLRRNPAENAALAALPAAAKATATAPNAMTPGSSALCCWPPPPPPTHWHRHPHRRQCWHTDEEEGRPRHGGRIPESGHAELGGVLAPQHQEPPAVAQPSSLANVIQQSPKAPQGQDKPVRSQEDLAPAAATAPPPPLRLRPAKSRP
jgi:hypothetical protein